ncbi:hypothetical protein BWI17_08385 [Betaproteobacteria bacterium GR16-43]|nr:hypothetical protein BWI17_08385 [Betaproteobacteria bacterium GR16-43]
MSVFPGPGAGDLLARARGAIQSGRPAEAEALLAPAVAAAPGNPDAHLLLGLALAGLGRLPESLAQFDRALQARPDHPITLHNRAQSLAGLGRVAEAKADVERALALAPDFDAAWLALGSFTAALGDAPGAERAYRRALALKATNPAAHYNLALLFQGQGRIEEAIAAYRKALAANPGFAAAHNNLGNALRQSGRTPEAVAHYAEALRLDPRMADAYSNYGLALQDLGRITEAAALLERAAALKPDSAPVLNNLGIALFGVNRFVEAETAYRGALALEPRFFEAHNNLGNTLSGQGREEEAMAAYRESIAISPDYADAHSNLGLMLQERGDVDGAIACYERALALRPDHSDALTNEGYLLQEKGRRRDAMALYRRALEANPRSARAAYNLGLAQLCEFEFEEGWERCELRYYTSPPVAVLRPFAMPTFKPEEWGKGHALAVWREQGIGDQLLYATLLPELEERSQPFVFEVDERLIPAFARSHPGWKVTSTREYEAGFAGCDRQISAASLPRLVRRTLESFDRQPQALLRADPVRSAAYRARLAAPRRRVVGISWRSFQPKARGFLQRKKTAPLAAFADLARRPDLTLLDLQYGDTAAEREAFAREPGVRLARLEELDLFNDIDGVLAAVEACDAIVTTSNVAAHYAGALGKRTLLLYPGDNPPFHYWSTDASGRCLWYPSVRIVTGRDLHDWPRLLARAHELLDA